MFRSALLNSDLCNVDHCSDSAEAYFDMYHNILQSLADQFAPVKKVTIRHQRLYFYTFILTCTMDGRWVHLRRNSRRWQRRYRKSKQICDRLAWIQAERTRHRVYRRKETSFRNLRLSEQSGQPKKLWQSISTLMGSGRTKHLPGIVQRRKIC